MDLTREPRELMFDKKSETYTKNLVLGHNENSVKGSPHFCVFLKFDQKSDFRKIPQLFLMAIFGVNVVSPLLKICKIGSNLKTFSGTCC